MSEYIEREAAKKFLVQDYAYAAAKLLDYVPAADVVEVRHGGWVVENEHSIRCSECCFNRASIKMPLNYCPSCGAKAEPKWMERVSNE